jgi:AbrB family looped-hinge helix DNA binding protein
MELIVNVAEDGQITIPKKIREKYGIKNKILCVEEEFGVRLKPCLNKEKESGFLVPVFIYKQSY